MIQSSTANFQFHMTLYTVSQHLFAATISTSALTFALWLAIWSFNMTYDGLYK